MTAVSKTKNLEQSVKNEKISRMDIKDNLENLNLVYLIDKIPWKLIKIISL